MAQLSKTLKAVLRHAKSAVIGATIGIGAVSVDESLTLRAIEPLTPGEAALAQSVFGDDFSTANLRKYYHTRLPFTVARTNPDALAYVRGPLPFFHGNALHFAEGELQGADLSQGTAWQRSTFMHEMTHVWQQRNGGARNCDVYDYALDAQSRFADFCNEQQASIVGDYVTRFLLRNLLVMQTEFIDEGVLNVRDAQLARVVEEQFPAARAARLRLNADVRQRAQACLTPHMEAQPASTKPHRRLVNAWIACTPTAPRPADATTQPWPQRTAAHIVHSFRRWG